MEFMQPQITVKLEWVIIDGDQGTTWIPAEDCPKLAQAMRENPNSPEARELALEFYQVFSPEHLYSLTFTTGYGARLSAPGYLDCTEWSVFDTPEEARKYLADTYEDEWEEDADEE